MKLIYFCAILFFGIYVVDGSKANRFIETKNSGNTDETVNVLKEVLSVMKGSVALQRENRDQLRKLDRVIEEQVKENELLMTNMELRKFGQENSNEKLNSIIDGQAKENILLENSVEKLNRVIDELKASNELLRNSLELRKTGQKNSDESGSVINEQEEEKEHSKNSLDLEKISQDEIVEKRDFIIEGHEKKKNFENISVEYQVEGMEEIFSEIDNSTSEIKEVSDKMLCMFPRNCYEIRKSGDKKRGIRKVCPLGESSKNPIDVLCYRGWTVIQTRRSDIPIRENFTRGWKDYVSGFGEFDGEFWLGLENIYRITKAEPTELKIYLTDSERNEKFITYESFSLGNSEQNYRLDVGGRMSGTVGDSLKRYHNSQEFSTYDSDNGIYGGNCAKYFKGGWWFNSCYHSNISGAARHHSNLNGLPRVGEFRSQFSDGIIWKYFKGLKNSLAKVLMLCRPHHPELNDQSDYDVLSET